MLPVIIAAVAIAALAPRRAAVGATVQVGYPMEDHEQTRAAMQAMANGFAKAGAIWLHAHPEILEQACCSSCAGFRYVGPPTCGPDGTCQRVTPPHEIAVSGQGTCMDLAIYDTAAALAEGKRAYVEIVHVQGWDYHAYAVIDGQRTDPAAEVQAANVGCGCGGVK